MKKVNTKTRKDKRRMTMDGPAKKTMKRSKASAGEGSLRNAHPSFERRPQRLLRHL